MRLKNNVLLILLVLTISLFTGCKYGFKGISIPAETNTFFVETLDLTDLDAPATLNQEFSEALRTKIRNESKLSMQEDNPDILFSGKVNYYQIDGVAPEEGNTTSLNRMEIGVLLDYNNSQNQKSNWTAERFRFFLDFDANADLNAVQEDLIEQIINQLTENIFNKAFTDW